MHLFSGNSATPPPPASLLPPLWQLGFDWLNQVTQGAITIKQYGGGTLYGVNGGINALRAGIADYGTCYSNEEAHGFELIKTLQLPFVMPAQPWLRARIVAELAATHLQKEYTARGVYLAHILPTQPLKILSKTPIRIPQDLRGKKVFSTMNAPGAAQSLGYSEVRVPFPELYSAFQLGIVDTVIWLDVGIIPYKLYEQARYYTDVSMAITTVETCFNQRSYDSLPTSLKPLMIETQQHIALEVARKTIAFSAQAQQTLQSKGVEILQLNGAERQSWSAAYQPIRENWFTLCAEVGKDCRALVAEIEAKEKHYAALDETALMKLNLLPPTQTAR